MGPSVAIHPTALVSPSAELGAGVEVGPYSIVEGGARIGDGTRLEAFVKIGGAVEIGRDCHIFENTVLGCPPQDHDFGGESSFVRIADGVVLRENVTIHRATGEGAETYVGEGTLLMEGCHLGHNVRIGAHCTVTNKVGISGHSQLGDNVVVGGLAGFHQFVRVGSYAMVGGMAKIIKDVPPYSMADGVPARVRGLNTIGLRRNGFSQEERTRIKNIYKLLYDRHMRRSEAIALLEKDFPGDRFALEIAAFARATKRGLTKWIESDPARRMETE
ncbi:MAG: acyl-ACP--UDP-N-acetylglucosamine O-acyltransferase [Synergistaceae bacterium]|jgi:UDP-N-acetylglucosamine acyltransferase|nr:acyl-ACP--UDP-N-acetylglucosamine O-acyltransferase [Synergistaceae bacterium]